MYDWQVVTVQHTIRHIFLAHLQVQLLCYRTDIQRGFWKTFKALVGRKLWRLHGNAIQLPFHLSAQRFIYLFMFLIWMNRIKRRLYTIVAILYVVSSRLPSPWPWLLGRIEWSFRLSVAGWPFSLSIAWQYVCDTTGLYRCSDECFWSRSWQRRREIKRAEGREGPNHWLDYITDK